MSNEHKSRVPDYLEHILEAIQRIKQYTYDFPLRVAYEMRNTLAHGYFQKNT